MESKNSLSSVLEQKLALLKIFYLLTSKIKEDLHRGEVDNLWSHLSRREMLIQKIEKLDSFLREMMPLGEDGRLEARDRSKGILRTYHRETKELLEQIAAKENDLIHRVRAQSDGLKREILSMREARHAVVSYHNHDPFSPRFLDARK